jgi:uncharacterized protein YecT (DUF1311 family)
MKKIVLLSALFASLAFAEVKLSPSYDKCMDKSGGTTSSMLECADKETKIQDLKLNKAYKNAMKALEPKKQMELKDVQRLWVKYRDAHCGFYEGLTGGTMDSLNTSSCFLEMTAVRVEELEAIAE